MKFYEITNTGDTADIKIVGSIGWDVDSDTFTNDVENLVSSGVKNARVYINSSGGSVITAYEVVNQLALFDNVSITIGAIAASAAAYIACNYPVEYIAENGLMMIHECSISASGTAKEIESTLELMNKINETLKSKIEARLTDDGKAKLNEYWGVKDWWLTSQEAVDYGLCKAVSVGKLKVKDFVDVNIPQDIINKLINHKNADNMDENLLYGLLGLTNKSTAEDASAAMIDFVAKNTKQPDLEGIAKVEQITKVENALKDVQDALEKKIVSEKKVESISDQLARGYIENKVSDTVSSDFIKIGVIKNAADAPMKTTTVGIGIDNPILTQKFMGFAGLEPEATPVYNALYKGAITERSISWVNRTGKEGVAAFVDEGGVKPNISWEVEAEFAKPKKIAGFAEFTRELLKDFTLVARETELIIKNDLAQVIENELLNGTKSTYWGGGVTTSASAYTSSTLDDQFASPNKADAIMALGVQIQAQAAASLITSRMDTVFVGLGMKTLLRMLKDANGRSLTVEVDALLSGLNIIETPKVPATHVLGMDSSKWNVYSHGGLEVEWSNSHKDNFQKNIAALLVEQEIYVWHRSIDEVTAVYDTWVNIEAALKKP